MHKYILIFFGFVSLLLGIIGIFIPVLPTTPFILLAAALFVRSSEKLYLWLLSNKLLGKYIRKFRESGGMTIREKGYAIALMWAMIALSAMILNFNLYIFALGAVGTIVMGLAIKTVRPGK
jgi:uncharacterized membrane protein YbaN (DUF454 family)